MHIFIILGIIWLLLLCCTDAETRWEVIFIMGLLLWFIAQQAPKLEALL